MRYKVYCCSVAEGPRCLGWPETLQAAVLCTQTWRLLFKFWDVDKSYKKYLALSKPLFFQKKISSTLTARRLGGYYSLKCILRRWKGYARNRRYFIQPTFSSPITDHVEYFSNTKRERERERKIQIFAPKRLGSGFFLSLRLPSFPIDPALSLVVCVKTLICRRMPDMVKGFSTLSSTSVTYRSSNPSRHSYLTAIGLEKTILKYLIQY